MATVILDHVRPVRNPRPRDRGPVLKSIFFTADISARFLAAAAIGKGSVELADGLIDGYWRRILMSGNAKLVAEGREVFDSNASIVMSNHASILDIPAMMGAIPGSMRMVMKAELTKMPLWGPALVKSGFIPVNRGEKERAAAQLDRARHALEKGIHIWIAPEGTRSRSGELLPFKKGGFHLAKKLNVPIVPAWVDGAADIVPADAYHALHDGTITVKFGKKILPSAADSVEGLMEVVRNAMLKLRTTAAAMKVPRDEAVPEGNSAAI
jgi:1-acyl-sn-glycerol-3-phosphate acyltransferase